MRGEVRVGRVARVSAGIDRRVRIGVDKLANEAYGHNNQDIKEFRGMNAQTYTQNRQRVPSLRARRIFEPDNVLARSSPKRYNGRGISWTWIWESRPFTYPTPTRTRRSGPYPFLKTNESELKGKAENAASKNTGNGRKRSSHCGKKWETYQGIGSKTRNASAMTVRKSRTRSSNIATRNLLGSGVSTEAVPEPLGGYD